MLKIISSVLLLLVSITTYAQSIDTVKVIKDVRRIYSDIKSIEAYDSVRLHKAEYGEDIFVGAEEVYCFYAKGKLIKIVELIWDSGEGGVYNPSRREIYFNDNKPRFVLEQTIRNVFGFGEIRAMCEASDDCSVLNESRIYIDQNGFVIRKLNKIVSLDNEENILTKISNTPNTEVKLNPGEKFAISLSDKTFTLIEACTKADVYYPIIFPNELNENIKVNSIEPGNNSISTFLNSFLLKTFSTLFGLT